MEKETGCEEKDEYLAEYTETLHTSSTSKKSKRGSLAIWRDVESIENKVDNLHIIRAKRPITDVDRSVERLLEKDESKQETKKVSSNVIYVVSKPQPGEVKGDWAVRSHYKIYSHHKTKANAVKEARKVARQRDATVIVQNTDGKFAKSFKPRK
jgi:hypothetical protein